MSLDALEHRLAQVQARIRRAAEAAGRASTSVGLVAVSKRHSPQAVARLVAAGHRVFGESYVQEALPKQAALAHLPKVAGG